ncbi:hypothetical protein FKM82_018873 [Ascaphus truei]
MVAEVVKHFLPRMVEMHNYIPANSTQQKLSNWATLNRKVFSKLNVRVSEEMVRKLISNTSGAIEPVLCTLRLKINEKLQEKIQRESDVQHAKESDYYSINTGQPTYGPAALLCPTYGKVACPDPGSADRGQKPSSDGSSHPYAHLELGVRLLLEEKEQALLALQETVQILHMKVQRLEHLVQLKDLRIEDLTRHLNKQRGQRNIL